MADIFISYSSSERDKAITLSIELQVAGYSVWIDKTNLSAATQWSTEIVKAINTCSVFIILLSKKSLVSHNVIKELSLASESKKHIIPVNLERVELPDEVKYQLAGLQRVAYDEQAQIIEALDRFSGKGNRAEVTSTKPVHSTNSYNRILVAIAILLSIGFGSYLILSNHTASEPPVEKVIVSKKLIVLPFESLSTVKEDEFIADGLTTEVITTLALHYSGLVVDRRTSMLYKGKKDDFKTIGKDQDVRYILSGTLQKHGDAFTVTMQLFDVVENRNIRTESYDGTASEAIGIQKWVAKNIVDGLKTSLPDLIQKKDTTVKK